MSFCGGLATRLFLASARRVLGAITGRPSATRPQNAILPHLVSGEYEVFDGAPQVPLALRTRYAQIPAVLQLNHAGLHFHVTATSWRGKDEAFLVVW